METSAISIAAGTGPIVKFVLFLLIFASVFSWSVIFMKWTEFKAARKESQKFLDAFWNGQSLDDVFTSTENLSNSPISNVFRAGYQEFQKITEKSQHGEALDNVERALRKEAKNESIRLEGKLSHLATIASAAPFVGLFGTVWGIMNSFFALGKGGGNSLQIVAPGISEALIATAVGLVAAIPAVVAYNRYITRIRGFRNDMDGFSSDFTNILTRSYLGK